MDLRALGCAALMLISAISPAEAQERWSVRRELVSAETRGLRYELIVEEVGRPARTSAHEIGSFGALLEEHGLYVAAWDDRVFAIDLATDAVRWSLPIPGEPDELLRIPTTSRFLMAHGSRSHTRLVAIDARDGRTAWSYDGARGGEIRIAGGTVVIGSDEGVLAIDAASGRARWRIGPLPCPEAGSCAVAYQGHYAIDASASAVLELEAPLARMIDLASGRELWRTSVGPRERRHHPSARIAGTDAYVTRPVPRTTGDLAWTGESIVALDAHGNTRWTSRAVPLAISGGSFDFVDSQLHAAGTRLYVHDSGGALRVYDRNTGSRLWQGGLEEEEELEVRADGTAVVVRRGRRVTVYDPSSPPRTFRAHIHGRIEGARGEQLVRVGDTIVRSDARGRFSSTVEWHGRLTADLVPQNVEDELPATAALAIERAGAFRLLIELETCDGGCE